MVHICALHAEQSRIAQRGDVQVYQGCCCAVRGGGAVVEVMQVREVWRCGWWCSCGGVAVSACGAECGGGTDKEGGAVVEAWRLVHVVQSVEVGQIRRVVQLWRRGGWGRWGG